MSVAAEANTPLLVLLRVFRVGPLRLSAYGACAVAGVLLAMAVSGRAARRLRLPDDAAWDAGLFAVVSCFLASRLMLVVSDPKAFLRYPLLMLGLPSLTIWGMVLAGLATWAYLRWKRLPTLQVMDAFAPGAAVLAAFLELGHWMDGSEPGMPLHRPWAVQLQRNVLLLHPVTLYGVVTALLLGGGLWWLLRAGLRPGCVAAAGLGVGGLLAFGLDLLMLPTDLFASEWLEPGEVVALAAMLAGAVLWTFAPHPRRAALTSTEEKR